MEQFKLPERRVCRALNQPRSTQRYRPRIRDGEERLTGRMIKLATQYGRYGYRRITALLRREGFQVNYFLTYLKKIKKTKKLGMFF